MASESKGWSSDKKDGSGKTNHYFNRGSEDGGKHGHVVTSNDGETTHYARDEDGSVYVDDSKGK